MKTIKIHGFVYSQYFIYRDLDAPKGNYIFNVCKRGSKINSAGKLIIKYSIVTRLLHKTVSEDEMLKFLDISMHCDCYLSKHHDFS